MGVRNAVALLLGATVMAAGAPFDSPSKPTLTSDKPARPASAIPLKGSAKAPQNSEYLFRGDMLPDIGLGCSYGSGTTGGPNDWATKVTATFPAPFLIISTTYNIFTFNSGPTWDLVAWENGASPGAEIGRVSLGAANGTTGNHTAVVFPEFFVPAGHQTFFFGLSQGADTNGVRLGMDTGGYTPNTVFIRAPVCGAAAFGTVESLGFPGFWVHRILISEAIPVELMNFDVS